MKLTAYITRPKPPEHYQKAHNPGNGFFGKNHIPVGTIDVPKAMVADYERGDPDARYWITEEFHKKGIFGVRVRVRKFCGWPDGMPVIGVFDL